MPEIPEKDIRAGGGPGTSETDGGGDLRGVRDRDSRDGADGGSYSPARIVRAVEINWGCGQNHKESERAGTVSRVPGAQEEALGRRVVGGRILRPDSRRPNDSGRDRQVYRATSPTRARACAAGFEAALLNAPRLAAGILTFFNQTILKT